MKTRLRPLTVLFCILVLSILGGAIFSFLLHTESRPESWVTPFFAALFFIPLLCCVIWLTLLIRIDGTSQRVTFFYPFRFRKSTFHFDEIIGFRFQYRQGRIGYKAIQFKTTDGQKFTLTDCETANLRKLESYCLDHLDIRAGNGFRKLNNTEKQEEADKSRQFDVNQAKSIRLYLYLAVISLVIIAGGLLYGMLKNGSVLSFYELAGLIVLSFIVIIIALKLIRIKKRLKNKAEYAGNEQS